MMTERTGTDIPKVNIMGVDVAAVNPRWIMDYTAHHVKELSGEYFTALSVHAIVMASRDPEYSDAQNGAYIVMPDGGPVAAVGRRRGFPDMRKTAGPSYMNAVIKASGKHGYRHFFYGSTEETLAKMQEVIKTQYPGAVVAGVYSPPFRELTPEEDEEVIRMINEADADFVWIGLGAPRQELWMARHHGKIKGLMVGVGAAFDYLAGNIRRAPKWMQDMSLEWLYRLMQEPTRLFGRYFSTNMTFIWEAVIRGK